MKTLFGLTLTLLSLSVPLAAQTMAPVELFQRCYGHLTQNMASYQHPLMAQVRAGTLNPIDACLSLLDDTRLNPLSNRMMLEVVNRDTDLIFNTFNNLHTSWLFARDYFNNGVVSHYITTLNLLDSSNPSLFFSAALFEAGVRVDNVLTGTRAYRAIRTQQNLTAGIINNVAKSALVFKEPFMLADKGNLIGIDKSAMPWLTNSAIPASYDQTRTFGGGVLGSQSYLRMVTGVDRTFKADGAVKMPRRWARSAISDFLCRELPMVRPEDSSAFVAPTSTVPFRQVGACANCHATMDRMASSIRNINVGPLTGTGDSPDVMSMVGVTQSSETGWPAVADPNYYLRPPTGTLYYRDFRGNLVNFPVTDVSDLGRKLAARDDFYVCVAKRYYQYFTGYDVPLGDPGDPAYTSKLKSGDLAQKTIVIDLGLKLKQHQSLRQLIEDILNSPSYSSRSYGTQN